MESGLEFCFHAASCLSETTLLSLSSLFLGFLDRHLFVWVALNRFPGLFLLSHDVHIGSLPSRNSTCYSRNLYFWEFVQDHILLWRYTRI